ncbi:MAG: hypothetical protein JNG84_06365 [Archangium sp.]|nr:hypothetical protein [Archangium sp.]
MTCRLVALFGLMIIGCTGGQPLDPDDAPDAAVDEVPDGGGSVPDDTDAGAPTRDGGLAVIRIDGRKLLIDDAPFEIRAVAWNPVRRGGSHPGGLDFTGTVERDAQLMHEAGFNAVRTYVALTDRTVLDALHRHGLWVINSVYAWGGDPATAVVAPVRAVANHPAMLAWAVGNEWNYNGLYVGLSATASRDRLNEVMRLIRTVDTRLPIVNVYGEVPSADVVNAMPLTDIWALNVYRGLSFGNLFSTFAQRSTKPMMLGEYGADAWNALLPAEDQASQAMATEALTREIHTNWSGSGGVAIGGAIFEWCDEWWKDGAGRADQHDVGGIAPGGGPYPDRTFNEEWWGLVDIDRTPRAALAAARRGWGL